MKDRLDKVGAIQQIGGIETAVLDNGPARGSRIAWVNTGGGLRYKVAIDRGLDIADAFYNQHSLVWLSRGGLTGPRPDAHSGLEWLRTFAGGLMTTCGLTHIGGPESDENESRGLHGRFSNIPAAVESVLQPDPASGRMEMSMTALVRESKVFGPHLELRRTITSRLGEPAVTIHDEVINSGNEPCPHMLLYHCNFGWPLVDEGTEIVYKGACRSRGMDFDNELFCKGHNYKKCLAPLESHRGAGEACGFIDAVADADGFCHVGLVNHKLNLAVKMTYPRRSLPALTNWQHWGPGEYVCGLEPGTNPPIGQNCARRRGELILLEPGEKRSYELRIQVLVGSEPICKFLSAHQD
jgi:galactose mutarotase-like enzyme